jgi:hypothetical protein
MPFFFAITYLVTFMRIITSLNEHIKLFSDTAAARNSMHSNRYRRLIIDRLRVSALALNNTSAPKNRVLFPNRNNL